MLLFAASKAMAQQYCVPPQPIDGPYTGIKKVVLGTLSNYTSDSDGYTYYSSVAAPVLSAGSSMTIKVTTKDDIMGVGFTDKLNTRVWIDWNQDKDFNDAGEEVLTSDKADPGTVSATFTVPTTALNGTTRMRVYEDMPPDDGHDPPNTCGYKTSSNPLGQHGECEDYNVTITGGAASVHPIASVFSNIVISPNPSNGNFNVSLNTNQAATCTMELYDMSGKKIVTLCQDKLVSGSQSFDVHKTDLAAGLYILQITSNGLVQREKLQINN